MCFKNLRVFIFIFFSLFFINIGGIYAIELPLKRNNYDLDKIREMVMNKELDPNAIIKAKDGHLKPLLHALLNNFPPSYWKKKENLEIIDFILSKGGDPNSHWSHKGNNERYSLLLDAIIDNNDELLNILTKYNVDVNQISVLVHPLVLAVSKDFNMFKKLISLGANINFVKKPCKYLPPCNALLSSLYHNNLQVLQHLFELGVNVDLKLIDKFFKEYSNSVTEDTKKLFWDLYKIQKTIHTADWALKNQQVCAIPNLFPKEIRLKILNELLKSLQQNSRIKTTIKKPE